MVVPKPSTWNIFARELEQVLSDHDHKLGYLTNFALYVDFKPLVHPQTVDLLRQSLHDSTLYPTMLNPTQLERASAMLQFTPTEKQRLQAAILATAVQATLFDRGLDAEAVMSAAQEVFTIVFTALQKQPSAQAFQAVRDPHQKQHEDPRMTHTAEWNAMHTAINRAVLAWHLSRGPGAPQELLSHAYQAQIGFRAILAQLAQMSDHDEQWDIWQQEAEEGESGVAAIIAALTSTPPSKA